MVGDIAKVFFSFLLIANPVLGVVGGDIATNHKIVRLSKCRNIVSYLQGTSHGCSDVSLATGSFISKKEILTAGHFASHFIFDPKDHYLKINVGNTQTRLKFKEDFFIRVNRSYYKYEQGIRNNSIEPIGSIGTCSFDIAILELTPAGQMKITNPIFYNVEKNRRPEYYQQIEMYGYGNNTFSIYNKKTATFSSTLNWILSLGKVDRKTWVKEKSLDESLRVGRNILKPVCETVPDEQFKSINQSKVDTIESKVNHENYYQSFMASGDSGGPAIVDNKVIGVFCSINSFHSGEETRFVNLITPTYSDSLKGFWLNESKAVKVFR